MYGYHKQHLDIKTTDRLPPAYLYNTRNWRKRWRDSRDYHRARLHAHVSNTSGIIIANPFGGLMKTNRLQDFVASLNAPNELKTAQMLNAASVSRPFMGPEWKRK